MPRQVPYMFAIDFAAIAAMGSAVGTALVDAEADFVVERQRAVFWNDAAVGTTIAGTPFGLLGDMSPPAIVGNIWYNHNQLTVKMGSTSDPWTKVPMRLPLVFDVGGMDRPAILQRRIQAGTTLQAEIKSYINAQISGQLAFIGFKEYK